MDDKLDDKSGKEQASYIKNSNPDSVSKLMNIIVHLFSRRNIALAGILALVIGASAGTIAVQNSTETRQHAAEINKPNSAEEGLQPLDYDQSLKNGSIKPIGKILQINLTYDAGKSPTLLIDKIEKKNGYVPENIQSEKGYKLNLLDKGNTVLYSQYFEVPNQINGPPPLPGEAVTQDSKTLTIAQFALNTPFYPNVRAVEVFDPASKLIITKPIADTIPEINNKPNFHSKPGTRFLKNQPQGFLEKLRDFLFRPAFAANNDHHLDIVIISDQYSDFNAFHNDADAIVSHALTYEPLHTRASQISVHYVDNTASLGCYYDPSITRLILCNNQLIIQQVNNTGVPWDKIYVLVNNSNYGGSGSRPISVGYNGDHKGPMFAHEFMGHNLGGLLDEYNLVTSDGTLDNQTHGLFDNDGNCYAGSPPAIAWQGIVSLQDYTLGCNYPNWYRPSASSIMLTLATQSFNSPSQAVLNRRLDSFAGSFIPPQKGDVNCDGRVDIFDTSLILQYTSGLVKLSNTCQNGAIYKVTADIDNNNIIDGKDALQILRFLSGLPSVLNNNIMSAAASKDFDGDGFNDGTEGFINTKKDIKCSTTTTTNPGIPNPNWPPDLNNDNKVNGSDQLMFASHNLATTGQAKYSLRLDLNTDGIINGSDLLMLAPYFLKTCQ